MVCDNPDHKKLEIDYEKLLDEIEELERDYEQLRKKKGTNDEWYIYCTVHEWIQMYETIKIMKCYEITMFM